MKGHLLFILLFSSIFLSSCHSESTQKKEAEKIVRKCLSLLEFKDFEGVRKLYPNIGSFEMYTPKNAYIVNSVVNDENIIVKARVQDRFDIIFRVKKSGFNNYTIDNSRGLASGNNTPLYKFCEKIGCIKGNTFDNDINDILEKKKIEFNGIVDKIEGLLEESVYLVSNNISMAGGGYITPYASGSVTIGLSKDFPIQSSSYELYVVLGTNSNPNKTKCKISTYSSIGSGETVNGHIYQKGDYSKISALLEITDNSFIKNWVANNADGSFCEYSHNLIEE